LILDQVLHDVLTNAELNGTREFYGTPGDRQVALVSNPGYGMPWPDSYVPAVSGYTVHRVIEGNRDDHEPPMLGVRIDNFEPGQKESGIFYAPIEVTVLNAGGLRDGAIVTGGCSVLYTPVREKGGWTVELSGAWDP
jgi:hypothetical protein